MKNKNPIKDFSRSLNVLEHYRFYVTGALYYMEP